jgi:hypothetical protein
LPFVTLIASAFSTDSCGLGFNCPIELSFFGQGIGKVMNGLDDFRIPMLASIPPDELRKLLASARQTLFLPETIVFHEGDLGDSLLN